MHLGPELFKLMAGVDILHVPFRGAGPALIDVIGGDSQMSFASVPSTITHVRSGKLRAIGVGGMKRSFAMPDVPTIDEAGVPGYECANWIGLVAPAGTPEPIVARLHQELTAVQDSARAEEAVRQRGRRRRAHELGRVRRLHRERAREVGPGGEGGRHQAAVAAPPSALARGPARQT